MTSARPATAPVAYRDLSRLTTVLKICLAAFVVASIATIASGMLEIDLLGRVARGEEVAEAEASANDVRQGLAGLLYGLVFVATAVIFLRWTYLARRNARALGSTGMQYTPGWSIGWYFVPIATLWKPYQAMAELFRASHPGFSGEDWPLAPRPSMLPVWWAFWVTANFVDNAVFRLTWRGDGSIDELMRTAWLELVSSGLDVPLGVMALAVVVTLQNSQVAKHRRSTELNAAG